MVYDDTVDDTERVRQIRRVLSHYDENFTKYLAATIGLTERIPEEVNNQVRNAFTHLSRAQEAKTSKDFQKEIERAISHIDRANRDCLKASIIFARQKMDNLITDAVFYHAALTPDIKTRVGNIKKSRRDVYRSETQGRSDVVMQYESMLREIMFVCDKIHEEYQEVGTRRAKATRFIFRWSRPVISLAAAVLGYVAHPFIQPLVYWFKIQLSNINWTGL